MRVHRPPGDRELCQRNFATIRHDDVDRSHLPQSARGLEAVGGTANSLRAKQRLYQSKENYYA